MLVAGCWILVAGYWWLDTGGWILVAGYWWLDTGCWILLLEAGGWIPILPFDKFPTFGYDRGAGPVFGLAPATVEFSLGARIKTTR